MNVLDLFSGLGGWSAAFVERGHEVVTVDMLAKSIGHFLLNFFYINL